MTDYERKLVRYLSETDTVADSVLKKLIKLQKKYRKNGKDLKLDKLLVTGDVLSREQLDQVQSELEDYDFSSKEKQGDSDSAVSTDALSDSSVVTNVDDYSIRRATEEAEREAFQRARAEKDTGISPDDSIPGYQIKGVLGKGGTATVFEVEREDTGEVRALKMLYPKHHEDEFQVKQFKREGRLLMEFEHPHIVQAYDLDRHDGLWYLELELLHGTTLLEHILKNGALEEDRALDIVVEIADALNYMQEEGYVHRDVKSENVMLQEDGTSCTFDLGFAQEIGAEPEMDEGETQGTVYYMSPEQAKGQRELDIRSDIYSLGVTLYQMAVGELPFEGDEPREVMAKQVRQKLKGKKVKNQLSSHLHYIIEKMMSKEKDFRFQSPAEIIEEINGFRKAQEHFEYDPDPSETDINPF